MRIHFSKKHQPRLHEELLRRPKKGWVFMKTGRHTLGKNGFMKAIFQWIKQLCPLVLNEIKVGSPLYTKKLFSYHQVMLWREKKSLENLVLLGRNNCKCCNKQLCVYLCFKYWSSEIFHPSTRFCYPFCWLTS